jgi:hypothetical protein
VTTLLAVSTARTLIASGMCLVAMGSVLGICWASARRDDRRAAAGRHPSNRCPDEVEPEAPERCDWTDCTETATLTLPTLGHGNYVADTVWCPYHYDHVIRLCAWEPS